MRRVNLRAFTLIEMLVVMGIIMVLAAMIIPAIGLGKTKARAVRARTEVSQLQAALQRYRTEYLFWPNTSSGFDADEKVDETKATRMGKNFAKMLTGMGDMPGNQNKKKIPFFNFTTVDSNNVPITSFNSDNPALLHFYARFDTDLNGRVSKGTGADASKPEYYPTNEIGGEVVVWTFNPTEDVGSPLFAIGSWK